MPETPVYFLLFHDSLHNPHYFSWDMTQHSVNALAIFAKAQE